MKHLFFLYLDTKVLPCKPNTTGQEREGHINFSVHWLRRNLLSGMVVVTCWKIVSITLECFSGMMHLKSFCLSGKSQSYPLNPVFRSWPAPLNAHCTQCLPARSAALQWLCSCPDCVASFVSSSTGRLVNDSHACSLSERKSTSRAFMHWVSMVS